jgi:hypothetical protein
MSRGVIHRDLKPSNILLQISGARTQEIVPLTSFQPKIADFGLAKILDQTGGTTRSGTLLGTPKYMAPEQTIGAGHAINRTVDVYALGVILYEMLTGRPPYAGATVLDTLQQVRQHEPTPLRRLQPGLPRDLDTICLKAMAKEPARRYAGADVLAEDLTRFLDGRTIHARPVGGIERLGKAIRRRPAWAALAGLGVLMVVGMVVGVLYHNLKLQEQIQRADEAAARAVQKRDYVDLQYQQARLTLRRMLETLDQPDAGSSPAAVEVQRAQSEVALAFYESMAAGPEDPSPRRRVDLAAACNEAARFQITLGQFAGAEQSLRRAIRLLTELEGEAKDDPERLGVLATCFD